MYTIKKFCDIFFAPKSCVTCANEKKLYKLYIFEAIAADKNEDGFIYSNKLASNIIFNIILKYMYMYYYVYNHYPKIKQGIIISIYF